MVLGRDIGWGCMCELSWCYLDLTFYFAVVTLTLKFCLGNICEIVKCKKLIFGKLVGTLVRGCRCATSWCDLDLTFDHVVVTMSVKILFRLFFGFRKV